MANHRLCSIPGCGKPHQAKSYCRKHYQRRAYHNDWAGAERPDRAYPEVRAAAGEPIAEIKRAISHALPSECWIWPFNCGTSGYGRLIFDNRKMPAHRLVCELAHGAPSDPDHQAAHSCNVRRCINPHHLRWATVKENHADKVVHGTMARGERVGGAKLSRHDVESIRETYRSGQVTQTELAKKFEVSTGAISSVVNGKSWRWLKSVNAN